MSRDLTVGGTEVERLRIGVQLQSLQMPFQKALLTAAQMGAEAVEIDARKDLPQIDLSDTALRQIRKMLDDLNLRVCAVNFPTRRGYNVRDRLDERVEATKRVMQTAYRLGANTVINSVGHIPDEAEGDSWDLLLEVLDDLGRHGLRIGALLAADTGAEDGPVMRRLIETLPEGSLQVNLNPGQVLINGFSAQETTQELRGFVAHVHATDGVRDLARGRGLETPLGQGSADFPAIVATLEQFNYRGFYTVAPSGIANLDNVRNGVEYLRNLV